MKKSTAVFLMLVLASLLTFVGAFSDFLHPFITRLSVTEFPPVMQSFSGSTGNTYAFETPEEVPSKSVIFGNVTFCCTDAPSMMNSVDKRLPSLFILTSTQFQTWNVNRQNFPAYTATTLYFEYHNYSYSGPTRTETLSFRLVVEDSGIYHIVTFQVGSEEATLYLNMLSLREDETTLLAVRVSSILGAAIFIPVTIWDHKRK